MKIKVDNYIFDQRNKQITFIDKASIDLSAVLLMVNVTTNQIIYNFAQPGQGGTVSNNVLTLDTSLAGMSSDDELLIYYDDNDVAPASDNLVDALYELIARLDFLPSVRGLVGDLRVTPTATVATSLASTVASDITAIGALNAKGIVGNDQNKIATLANINNVVG
jgi:hypothetical protein